MNGMGIHKRQPVAATALTGLLILTASVGCNRSQPAASSGSGSPVATPKPSPTPTPRAVRAESTDFKLTMTDAKGQTVALLDAKYTNFDPLKAGGTVTVQGVDATLYDEGKAATRVRAENAVADQKSRIVTLTGNVRAVSLSRKDTPTVRAERMVWHADQKLLTGEGKVLMTLKPDFELPGRSFRADTKLNRMTVKQDERPGTGRF